MRCMYLTLDNKGSVTVKLGVWLHMLTDLRLDNRRSWVRGWASHVLAL